MRLNPGSGSKAEERWRLLNLRHLPCRVNSEEAGWLLGFNIEEMGILIQKNILRPLGNPAQNGKKFFATVQIIDAGQNADWLEKASKTVIQYWKARNALRN